MHSVNPYSVIFVSVTMQITGNVGGSRVNLSEFRDGPHGREFVVAVLDYTVLHPTKGSGDLLVRVVCGAAEALKCSGLQASKAL